MHEYQKLENLKALLPIRTLSLTGKPCEPITLIITGSKRHIQKHFIASGWSPAVGINPLSALRALTASVMNTSYPSGPISPLFINRKPQQLAFQRPTRSNTFRRRHHVRIWKTSHTLDGARVWVGMMSYDRSSGFYKHGIFPTHHIGSNLKSEENFLARTLGITKPVFIHLAEPEEGNISNGDSYIWDGMALLADFSG